MSKRQDIIVGSLVAFCCAMVTSFVSLNLAPRLEHRSEVIDQQFRILEGRSYTFNGVPRYFPEFQNRFLFAAVLKAAASLGGASEEQWYVALRLITGFLAFFVFWGLLRVAGGADAKTAVMAMGLMAYEFVLTYNHGWEHPTDYFDFLFIGLFIWSALQKGRLLMFLCVFLASCNRESSAFAGVIWFFLHALTAKQRIKFSEGLFAAGLSLSGYGMVILLRYLLGGEQALAAQTLAIQWWRAYFLRLVHEPSIWSWPVLLTCMALPICLWNWANRLQRPLKQEQLLGAGVVIALISMTFAILEELRIFIPAATVLVFASAAGGASGGREQNRRQANKIQPSSPAVVALNSLATAPMRNHEQAGVLSAREPATLPIPS
jgi:hypothetical protein